MRLNKKGITIERFMEMVSDDFKYLKGLPQPRTSGDLELLSEWFFGFNIEPDITGAGLFGAFATRNLLNDKKPKKEVITDFMKSSLAEGKGIGHVTINMQHKEVVEDTEFNEEATKRMVEKLGGMKYGYNLHSASYVARKLFFNTIFGHMFRGGGCTGYTCYSSTYYFDDLEKGLLIENWVKLSETYVRFKKRKRKNQNSNRSYMPWDKNDELRLEDAKKQLFKPSKQFMKEFNRFKSLDMLVK